VCVCVCVYVCVRETRTAQQLRAQIDHVCASECVCECVCIFLCVCVCMCVRERDTPRKKCALKQIVCASVCLCVCVFAYACVCVCMCVRERHTAQQLRAQTNRAPAAVRLFTFLRSQASSSRLLKIICLFCKRALQKRLYSAKETYKFACSHFSEVSSTVILYAMTVSTENAPSPKSIRSRNSNFSVQFQIKRKSGFELYREIPRTEFLDLVDFEGVWGGYE